MKLHDLRPPAGSTRDRTRVGRGIAAGKGKTAGRGTKGQKSRAGASIPAWFEGGQTPLQIRVPKLRGFKNRFKVEYEVVNVGRLEAAAEEGRFADAAAALAELEAHPSPRKGRPAAVTINAELLRAAGLIGSLRRPLKVLGGGELSRAFFVIADAVTRSARQKIEAAGGTVQLLERSADVAPLPPPGHAQEPEPAPAPAPEAESPATDEPADVAE